MYKGYIKISREILDWRWYCEENTFRLFFHLLLKANYRECKFEKHTIKRGQLITSRRQLSYELNMSERQVRTALEHLKSTNDIAIKPTTKYSIITVNDYETFQTSTVSATSNRLATDQQSTSDRPQYKKNKKEINNYMNRNASYSIDDFDRKSLFTD